MKMIPSVLFAALAAFTTPVAAESCHLSTACSGEEICINQECAPPPENLESCTDDENCEWGETCHDEYCKPGGVYCTNVAGSGHLRVSGGEIKCMNGSATGWENGMDCGSDGETIDCTSPDINDLTDMELEAMYEKCVTRLSDDCGTETPDPEETCTPDTLQICTDWSAFFAEVDANCEDEWGSLTVESPSRSNDSTDGEPDIGNGKDVDSEEAPDNTGDAHTGSGDSEDDVPQISGLFSPRGLAATANPWFIAQCCEAMEQEDEREEIEMFQGIMEACAAELSASDCDSFMTCIENYYDENGFEFDEVTSSSSDGLESDEDSGSSNDDRGGKDGDAQEAGSSTTDSPSNDSGCSISHIGQPMTSLLSLIF